MSETLREWLIRERRLLRANKNWVGEKSGSARAFDAHMLRERDDCLADVVEKLNALAEEAPTKAEETPEIREEDLPLEVAMAVTRRFCRVLSPEGVWSTLPLDPERVTWARKVDTSKDATWRYAVKSGRAIFQDKRNGWRKCHTDAYWVYWAEIEAEGEAGL